MSNIQTNNQRRRQCSDIAVGIYETFNNAAKRLGIAKTTLLSRLIFNGYKDADSLLPYVDTLFEVSDPTACSDDVLAERIKARGISNFQDIQSVVNNYHMRYRLGVTIRASEKNKLDKLAEYFECSQAKIVEALILKYCTTIKGLSIIVGQA